MAFQDTSTETVHGVPVVCVVGTGFCAPYPVELTVRGHGLFNSSYEALDTNGKLYLQVTGGYRHLQKQRVLRDAAGLPLLTMREKVLTPRHRWTVHRGDVKDQDAFLFAVQRSSSTQTVQFRHEVFLASNVDEHVPNFQVVETRQYRSYRAYKGDTLIAEVNFELSWGGFCRGTRNFRLKVYPGVDYAFMVALVVILNENDLAFV